MWEGFCHESGEFGEKVEFFFFGVVEFGEILMAVMGKV